MMTEANLMRYELASHARLAALELPYVKGAAVGDDSDWDAELRRLAAARGARCILDE